MNDIKIKKLTPELAEDYVHFFDVTPHNAGSGGKKCYCVTWRNDDSFADVPDCWFPFEEERRAYALKFVRNGGIQGYLAYSGTEAVGWCNANSECKFCLDYLRSYYPIDEYSDDVKVKSVFCFAVAPEMRKKGIATLLLEYVCKDAADDGFDFVEAYVDKNLKESDCDFRGSVSMYEKCGFRQYAELNGKAVMRKALR